VIAVPFVSAIPAGVRDERGVLPPYQTQMVQSVLNACGPACALMLARWVGRALNDTVAQWANRIDASHDGTTASDLAGMLKALCLTPQIGAATALPRIELVQYNRLPVRNPAYQNSTFLHWIVRLTPTSYHDPLRAGDAGAGLLAPADVIDAAIVDRSMSVGIIERPQETPQETTMSEQKIVKAQSWNVRTAPSTSAPIAGVLVNGDEITVVDSLKVGGYTWYAFDAKVGGAQIKQASDEKTPMRFYVRSDGFTTNTVSTTPAPSTPAPVKLQPAASLLGVHELSGQGRAKKSLELGARAVMCFEDALGAAQLSLAYPDAIVMHRKDFRHPLPARELLGAHGIDPNQVSNSRAWYRGANENDVETWGSDVESIRRRAAFDIECATLLKRAAPNAKWVAGGFAHGCPDFTNQAICDVIREVYAPAYNAGLIAFDIHSYSKCDPGNPKNYRFYAPIWFERRWEFLFTKCGFDPTARNIVSTETGGECGAGGFNWAGFTPDEFRAWCAFYLKVQQQSLLVNGRSYPSPFLAATLFQWGNTYGGSGGWLGYALDNYIGTLQSAWAGQLPAEKALEMDEIALYAGEMPAYEVPPAKPVTQIVE